jgi:hypothetical protein
MKRLVTVTGSRTSTLKHMLNHYKDLVDEMYVVVYEWEGKSLYESVNNIVSQFPTAKIIKRVYKEKFNWEYVTKLYNEIKMMYPDDWWIVSDDDEFHVYSKNLNTIIDECESNGWVMVRGGFVDRIGREGEFSELKEDVNIFEQFPLAGCFRYPLSNACPNKMCIMKGWVELTPGQHYAKIDGQTTWKWQGWNHPLINPNDHVQVHHFKWDKTCIDRIKAVVDVNQEYAYSNEYSTMFLSLRKSRFKINVNHKDYMIEHSYGEPEFKRYKQWNKLIKKIISI